MNKTNRFLKFFKSNKFILIILFLIPIPVYFRWFNFDIFNYGDWSYKHIETLKSFIDVSPWISNVDHGSFDELLWRLPLTFLYGVFAYFGFGFNVSEKILVFWPIAVTSVMAPYLLVLYITKNKLSAIIATVFYATNTYFLAINPQGHSLLPLACNTLVLSFTMYIKGISRLDMRLLALSSLLLCLAGVFDFRLFYIGAIIFMAFFMYWLLFIKPRDYNIRMLIGFLSMFAILTGLMQVFWILPTLNSGSESKEVLSRSLFGNEFLDLVSAITLHHPFWTGQSTSWFIVNSPPFYFWIIPLIALSAFFIRSKNKYILFFLLVTLVGVLLSKQVGEPFSGVYEFLFNHLPGFSAFREATKFYFLILLGYSCLIGIVINYLYENRRKIINKYSLAAIVSSVMFIGALNSVPYVTGSMQKLFTARNIPADYNEMKKGILGDQDYYRTLWVPTISKWGYYDTNHPRASILAALNIYKQTDGKFINAKSSTKQITDFISSPSFEDYLSKSSVKYVVVPSRDLANQDDVYRFFGFDRDQYIEVLNKVPILERSSFQLDDVVVYENKLYKPYINVSSNIYNFENAQLYNNSNKFVENNIDKNFNYSIAQKFTQGSLAQNLYSSNSSSITKGGKFSNSFDVDNKDKLFINTNSHNVSYAYSDSSLTLYNQKISSVLTGQELLSSFDNNKVSRSFNVNSDKTYYIQADSEILKLFKGTHDLGSQRSKYSVFYTNASENLVENGSFEDGLWGSGKQICNDYDGTSYTSLSLNRGNAADKINYVTLGSGNKSSCITSNEMPVISGKYLISFSYKSLYGEKLHYKIKYNNGLEESIYEPIKNGSNEWRNYRGIINIPNGVSIASIQLIGMAPSEYSYNESIQEYTSFDNVVFSPIKDATQVFDNTSQFVQTPLTSGKLTASYTHNDLNGSNLIKNGSFEDGLWENEVSDCGVFDSSKPKIGMTTSSKAFSGQKSLELSASSHTACTSIDKIAVDESKNYKLSFSYQSPNSSNVSFTLSFDDQENSSIRRYIPATSTWKQYYESILIPQGAKTMRLTVYTDSDSQDQTTYINRYDDFSFVQIPNVLNNAYVVKQQYPETNATITDVRAVNSYDKTALIKQANGQLFIQMSESYNTQWHIYVNNNKIDTTHIKSNGFGNSWLINVDSICEVANNKCEKNSDGTFNIPINIRYDTQNSLKVGLMISFIGLTLTLLLIFIRKRGKKP